MAVRSEYKVDYVNAEDASSDVTGASIDSTYLEVISFQFVWTGTITGTLDVELSNDGVTWTPALIDTTALDPSGSAGSGVIELETASRFVRSSYIATSGTGNMSVHYSAKSLG
jgi:hypothetical protein